MSDFLKELTTPDAPVEREVSYGDKKGSVYFRRISAGERAQLVKDQKVVRQQSGSYEFDVGENLKQKHMLVQFSVCNPDGSRYFKSLADVEKLGAMKVDALHKHALDVNREDEDDAGKA